MQSFQRLVQICIIINAFCNLLNIGTYQRHLTGVVQIVAAVNYEDALEVIAPPMAKLYGLH